MKKTFTIILALVLCLSVSVTVFASTEEREPLSKPAITETKKSGGSANEQAAVFPAGAEAPFNSNEEPAIPTKAEISKGSDIPEGSEIPKGSEISEGSEIPKGQDIPAEPAIVDAEENDAPAESGSSDESDAAQSPISQVAVPESKFVYSGEALEPSVIVYTEDGEVLAPEQYSVSYVDNVNAGTAIVHVDGLGVHEGESAEAAFQITRAAITDAVLKYSSMKYTGEKRTQSNSTQVYCGDTLLTRNTDYKISYTDNIGIGTATMTIKGKGNYSGTLTRTFEIVRLPIKSAVLSYKSAKYTGKAMKPDVTVKAKRNGETVILTRGTDYSLSYKNNKNVGTATVTVRGRGNYQGTLTKSFKITSVKISKAALAYTSVRYNGKAKKPKVTVTASVNGKKKTLKKGTDYKVSYRNNVNVGTATVTVTGQGNYYGTIKKTFRIKPIPLNELSSGDIVDEKMVRGIESQYFKSYVINYGDNIYNYINGKSYRDNPYFELSDLRYIKVLHYNYDHKIQVGEIIVNRAIAKDTLSIFRELFDAEYEIYSMYLIDRFWTGDPITTDTESCHFNNTSGFCFRAVTNGSNLSRHAYGMAIDINTQQNPYVWYENGVKTVYDENSRAWIDRTWGDPHMIVTGDVCWQAFTRHGFSWGGDWLNPIDYQHWEK